MGSSTSRRAHSMPHQADTWHVCRALQDLGANIEGPETRTFNELSVEVWPRVSWSPKFAVTYADLKASLLEIVLRLLRSVQ